MAVAPYIKRHDTTLREDMLAFGAGCVITGVGAIVFGFLALEFIRRIDAVIKKGIG